MDIDNRIVKESSLLNVLSSLSRSKCSHTTSSIYCVTKTRTRIDNPSEESGMIGVSFRGHKVIPCCHSSVVAILPETDPMLVK